MGVIKQATFKVDEDIWRKFLSGVREISSDNLTASSYLNEIINWCLSQEDFGMKTILGEIPEKKIEKGDDSRLAGVLETLISKIDGLDSRLSSLEGESKKS